MSADVLQPTREKEEAEKNEREEGVKHMKLYPQSVLMAIHNEGVTDKEQRQEVKGKEKIGQDETQRTARTKSKETFQNPKERWAREEKKMNGVTPY